MFHGNCSWDCRKETLVTFKTRATRVSFVHWRIGEELNCYCNNFHWHIWRGNREHFLCKSFCTVSASRTPLDLEAQSMKFWIICGWQNFFLFTPALESESRGCQNKQENFQKTSKASFSLKPDWITTYVSLSIFHFFSCW